MPGGPQPMDHNSRMALVRQIAARIQSTMGDRLLAIGLYGSLARNTDGPYSDIEMMCALRSQGEEYTHEWSYGPGKAEVNFLSQDILLAEAAALEGEWPLTHGAFHTVLALHDPEDLFGRVRALVTSHSPQCFVATIRAVIVGDIYERVGKLRNARHWGQTSYLPMLATEMTRYGAFLVGLANRHCYTTGARLLEESLALPGRPQGYAPLCRMVMAGTLSDPDQIAAACEAFWAGVERWAAERHIPIDEEKRIPF